MKLVIRVQNFKSIGRCVLNLNSGLNVLIGPNASGKTCLLSSLKFVRDLLVFGVAQALAHNGGARRVYRRGKSVISFRIIHDYGERIYKRKKRPSKLIWEIRISQSGPDNIAIIEYEKISILVKLETGSKTVFRQYADRRNPNRYRSHYYMCEPDEYGRDLFSVWDENYYEYSKDKIQEEFTAEFRELSKLARDKADRSLIPSLIWLDGNLHSLYLMFIRLDEYSLLPDIARQSTEQLPFAQMQPNGAGVGEVIHALEKENFERIELGRYYGRGEYLGQENLRMGFPSPYYFRYRYIRYSRTEEERKRLTLALENINRELSSAVKPIESVSVETDPTNGRRFVVFNAGKYKFYPEEVSDGTIKWLCILVSILVPSSDVYLLEEPENFLHPWMQQRLIEIMREHAKLNDTIFILSTHSTTILNSVLPKEVHVVEATEDGTRISKIALKSEIEKTLEKSGFRLGDYWVSGAIGGVP